MCHIKFNETMVLFRSNLDNQRHFAVVPDTINTQLLD